jgi:hypothetical protein
MQMWQLKACPTREEVKVSWLLGFFLKDALNPETLGLSIQAPVRPYSMLWWSKASRKNEASEGDRRDSGAAVPFSAYRIVVLLRMPTRWSEAETLQDMRELTSLALEGNEQIKTLMRMLARVGAVPVRAL